MKKMIASLVLMFCVSPAFAQAEPTIEFSIASAREFSADACQLTYQFTNNTPVTLTSLSVAARVMDKNNQLISQKNFYVDNLRSSKTRSVETYVTGGTCAEISRIVVEDVTRCQDEKTDYTGCMKILRLLPGRVRLTTK